MNPPRRTVRRAAALVHLAASAFTVTIVAAVLFGFWYPGPFRHLSGGVTLFLILAGVDIVLGPLLTAIVFSPTKSRRALVIDLSVIVVLQACALGYGAWTMAAARPVWLAFEVDLFRVVAAIDVDEQTLADAPQALRTLSWSGPRLLATEKPVGDRQVEATMLGLQGVHLAMQPRYWAPFDPQRAQVWERGRRYDELPEHVRRRLPSDLQYWPGDSRPNPQELRWLPAVSARASWTVFVDRQGSPVAFAPIEAP